MTNTSTKYPDSRFKIQGSEKKLLQSHLFCLDSRFKIQGWRPSDSRSFLGILNLESYPLGFKKFFLSLESWILPPWIQEVFSEPWILNPTPLDSRSFFWALNLESWILPSWIQEVFSEPWILNLESYPLGFKKFFLSLESWILNLWCDVLREGWDGNRIAKKMQFLITRKCPKL